MNFRKKIDVKNTLIMNSITKTCVGGTWDAWDDREINNISEDLNGDLDDNHQNFDDAMHDECEEEPQYTTYADCERNVTTVILQDSKGRDRYVEVEEESEFDDTEDNAFQELIKKMQHEALVEEVNKAQAANLAGMNLDGKLNWKQTKRVEFENQPSFWAEDKIIPPNEFKTVMPRQRWFNKFGHSTRSIKMKPSGDIDIEICQSHIISGTDSNDPRPVYRLLDAETQQKVRESKGNNNREDQDDKSRLYKNISHHLDQLDYIQRELDFQNRKLKPAPGKFIKDGEISATRDEIRFKEHPSNAGVMNDRIELIKREYVGLVDIKDISSVCNDRDQAQLAKILIQNVLTQLTFFLRQLRLSIKFQVDHSKDITPKCAIQFSTDMMHSEIHVTKKNGKICNDFLDGYCKRGKYCHFEHQERVKEDKKCYNFLCGNCSYGDRKCKYLHVYPQKENKLCFRFQQGDCPFVDNGCRFIHEKPEPTKKMSPPQKKVLLPTPQKKVLLPTPISVATPNIAISVTIAQPSKRETPCHYGDACSNRKCSFGHSSEWKTKMVAKAQDPHEKVILCKYFLASKPCPFGHKCGFAHDPKEIAANLKPCPDGKDCQKVATVNGKIYTNVSTAMCIKRHPGETTSLFVKRTTKI